MYFKLLESLKGQSPLQWGTTCKDCVFVEWATELNMLVVRPQMWWKVVSNRTINCAIKSYVVCNLPKAVPDHQTSASLNYHSTSAALPCASIMLSFWSHRSTSISHFHYFLLIDFSFSLVLSNDAFFVFLIRTNHLPAVTWETRKWNCKRWRKTSEHLYSSLCLDITWLSPSIFSWLL